MKGLNYDEISCLETYNIFCFAKILTTQGLFMWRDVKNVMLCKKKN